MTKVDIVSGFLGAGKTTFIKQLIEKVYKGEKLVLIENEFGEIGVDSSFLKNAGIEITEMNSGCICCTLVGDFAEAMKKVVEEYQPDRIVIEPSGVGKLSDVIKAVEGIEGDVDIALDNRIAVVNAKKAKMYRKNFGEFFENQVAYASLIVLSRTSDLSEKKLNECLELLKKDNEKAAYLTTEWNELSEEALKHALIGARSLVEQVLEMHEHDHHHHAHDEECGCGCHDHEHEHHHHHDHEEECCCHDHEHEHHHHHDHEEECCCHDHEHEHHHHHDHEEECCCHDHEHEHHHHHDHEEECCCHDHEHEHHHHHEHDEECGCGCHDHHHHHADEVFTSWGIETVHKYDKEALASLLEVLAEEFTYGIVLRAKGIVAGIDGQWMEFDLTPGEYEIRPCAPDYTGRLCVIGQNLKEEELMKAFS